MDNLRPLLLPLSPGIRVVLAAVGITGLLGPNAWFLWKASTDFTAVQTTLADPIALVFVGEAFALMLLAAGLIHATGRRPGALAFLGMSLLGGLLFSVPAWLWLASRPSPDSEHRK